MNARQVSTEDVAGQQGGALCRALALLAWRQGDFAEPLQSGHFWILTGEVKDAVWHLTSGPLGEAQLAGSPVILQDLRHVAASGLLAVFVALVTPDGPVSTVLGLAAEEAPKAPAAGGPAS